MVDTNVGMALLKDDKAAQARVVDGDQRVDLTLREPYKQDDRDLGKEVYFYFASARATANPTTPAPSTTASTRSAISTLQRQHEAGAAMAASSVLVVANSLRLRAFAPLRP